MENAPENGRVVVETEIFGEGFELTVVPVMADYKNAFDDVEANGWKEKLALKLGNALLSAFDHMLLRVGCSYQIKDVADGDVIEITQQEYLFGTFDRFNLFELIPMAYMFFEASCRSRRFALFNAFETNRKDVIKGAKKLSLLNFGLHLIVTYPFQVGRIKRLSSNKKIMKTLMRFNALSDEKRADLLKKWEKSAS